MEWKAQLHKINEDDLDIVIWRYLTFPKFIHLISYGALWFCRLQKLVDEFEGRIPDRPLDQMRNNHLQYKEIFPSNLHKSIDEMPERNAKSGRSLTVVNCWFIGEQESQTMWDEYVGITEGVAVKSTAKKLRNSVYLPPDRSFIGKVEYVDFEKHEMSTYEANQAHYRAFLKDKFKFSHENELRISTMNIKNPACLDPLGKPFSKEEISGAKMNNYDESGLHVRADLRNLFDTVVLHPSSQTWFKNLIKHLSHKGKFNWKVESSALEKK